MTFKTSINAFSSIYWASLSTRHCVSCLGYNCRPFLSHSQGSNGLVGKSDMDIVIFNVVRH